MKRTPPQSRIEILETRIAPSTVDVIGGVLTFTAGAGETNTIDFRIQGGNYRISDGADPTITAAAQAFGYVSEGMGTGAVHGSMAVTGLGLGSSLPSTPGYIGIYQFVAVTVLPPFGIDRSAALAYMIVAQALGYLLVLVLGLMALYKVRTFRGGAFTPGTPQRNTLA